ncbi:20-hydroxyecdysone protein [Eurosta solidaginis]|uniref:20-hydroxyecdysone protein n=1 Tax=Eurosta solidaginis TaxID=178769 RepID=UPI003531138C
MRYSTFRLTPLSLLLLTLVGAHAGLVHRLIRNENVKSTAASESLIPVQIIQEGEQLDTIKDQPERRKPLETEKSKDSSLLSVEVLATAHAPDAIDEKIVETGEKISDTSALLISEPLADKVLEQQFQQALADEHTELLQEEPATAAVLSQAQEINSELKKGVPAAADDAAASIYYGAPAAADAERAVASAEALETGVELLKSESLIADSAPAESQDASVAVQAILPAEGVAATKTDSVPAIIIVEEERVPAEVALRQAAATQATPTQTTTQANFVQQLIQNSPIGQFLGQLTGQSQQQQQPPEGAQIAADQPATPAPTLPGFLNPQNAITQVQNAAQSVANATAQAFQGVQQFASSLGNQFQSTFSNLGGQSANTADSTTPRPPGPIQSLISNFVGGNPTPAGAATAAGATQSPAQQQGPLQGFISFFQGGNRPQSAAAAPASTNAPSTQLDNKVEELHKDEQTNELTDAAHEPEEADQADNEVRNSAEVAAGDSLEDNSSGQFIIVNDDVSQQDQQQEEVKSAVSA